MDVKLALCRYMQEYDIVLLTESRYHQPKKFTDYILNVLQEDKLVQDALEKLGLRTFRLTGTLRSSIGQQRDTCCSAQLGITSTAMLSFRHG